MADDILIVGPAALAGLDMHTKIEQLRQAVALLNSMVLSGEDHSDQSRGVVRQAMNGGSKIAPQTP